MIRFGTLISGGSIYVNRSTRNSRIKRNRRQSRIYDLYISKKGCTDCGQVFPMECYDFDHTDGSTGAERNKTSASGGFKSLLNKSLKFIFKEMRKGDFVCKNCHALRSHSRGQFKAPATNARNKYNK